MMKLERKYQFKKFTKVKKIAIKKMMIKYGKKKNSKGLL
jgi:hypothetical protein